MGNPADPKGYTSKYLDVDFTPEYPFGYGLSYSEFQYSNLRSSAPAMRGDETLTVSADITNRGTRPGTEVVQFYVHAVAASVVQPVRLLKGFHRVALEAGETKTVSFPITRDALAFHNQQMQLVSEPGTYQVWIAPDSVRGLEGHFTLQ
jgi:beta-glucosidase